MRLPESITTTNESLLLWAALLLFCSRLRKAKRGSRLAALPCISRGHARELMRGAEDAKTPSRCCSAAHRRPKRSVWIPPIGQRAKVEAFAKADGFRSWLSSYPMASRARRTRIFSTKVFKCSRTARPKSFCLSSSRPADDWCPGTQRRADRLERRSVPTSLRLDD